MQVEGMLGLVMALCHRIKRTEVNDSDDMLAPMRNQLSG